MIWMEFLTCKWNVFGLSYGLIIRIGDEIFCISWIAMAFGSYYHLHEENYEKKRQIVIFENANTCNHARVVEFHLKMSSSVFLENNRIEKPYINKVFKIQIFD